MKLADIFVHCQNLDTMRLFYTDILELEETFYSNEYRHLVYALAEGLSMVVLENPRAEVKQEWSNGPVFQDGTSFDVSWTIRVPDIDQYIELIGKLVQFTHFYEVPQWVGYWSYIVKDPMGNTVDVYFEYTEIPENISTWEELNKK